MRQHLFLLAASGGVASARWLRWSGSEASERLPVETGTSTQAEGADGWTPKPTPAPEYGELRRNERRQTMPNTWLNDKTCGWVSGISSSPYTCGQGQKCVTNTDNVVFCSSGALEQFFTVCFDLAASKEGKCEQIGQRTGCCNKPEASACATYIWSGTPARSMYTCGPVATFVHLNDQPQFVIDASKSTTTSTTPAPTPGSNTTGTTSTTQAGPTTSASPPSETTGGSNTNLGVIIGSAVGGLFGLILLLLLLCCLCRRRNRNKKTTTKSSNNKTINITHTVPLGRVKRSQDLPTSSSSNIPGLYGPYVANAAREERGRESNESRDAGTGRAPIFGALLGLNRNRGGSSAPATTGAAPPRPERPDHVNPTASEAYRPGDSRHDRDMSGSTVREATLPPPPQPPQTQRQVPLRTPSPPSPPRLGGNIPARTPSPPSPASPEVYPIIMRQSPSAGGSNVGARSAGGEARSGPVRKKQGPGEMTVYF